ncbi:MAG TPA: maleylpyruvate isomerase family mycothiol-dependent enzyme, partial [Pseudolysinimonas sp.]
LVAGLAPEVASRPDVLAARERLASAAAAVPPGRRVRIASLGAVLIEALELAELSGGSLTVDPVTSGAVALDRSLRAPHALRAVIRDRTVRAVDADWEFGTGPVLTGTASAIVLFLAGRAGVPGG